MKNRHRFLMVLTILTLLSGCLCPAAFAAGNTGTKTGGDYITLRDEITDGLSMSPREVKNLYGEPRYELSDNGTDYLEFTSLSFSYSGSSEAPEYILTNISGAFDRKYQRYSTTCFAKNLNAEMTGLRLRNSDDSVFRTGATIATFRDTENTYEIELRNGEISGSSRVRISRNK
jgi:hypothetical protein